MLFLPWNRRSATVLLFLIVLADINAVSDYDYAVELNIFILKYGQKLLLLFLLQSEKQVNKKIMAEFTDYHNILDI